VYKSSTRRTHWHSRNSVLDSKWPAHRTRERSRRLVLADEILGLMSKARPAEWEICEPQDAAANRESNHGWLAMP